MSKTNEIDDKIRLHKEGDMLYRVTRKGNINELYVEPITIIKATYSDINGKYGHWYYHDNKNRSYFNRSLSQSCFETKEDAEKEIQRRKNIAKKRILMKEYERKLNEELNINDNYIIK